jgi:hypothetical protein
MIDGRDYMIALSPETLKVTLKGHRLGVDIKWIELVSGEAALATALQASLGKFTEVKKVSPLIDKRIRATVQGKHSRKRR